MITADFFKQDAIEVARKLLGSRITFNKNNQTHSGYIVETEAYLGLEDPSCHSFHGQITPRTEVFYKPAGYSYVYLIYGMYYCLNFITGDERTPEAVLIRAIEPIADIETMKLRRKKTNIYELCNGPGKLCQAFGINFAENALPLETGPFRIELAQNVSNQDIIESERVGLNRFSDSAHWPLRFYIKNSPFVSKP